MDTSLPVASPSPSPPPLVGKPAMAGGEGGFVAELLRAAGAVPQGDPATIALPQAMSLPGPVPEEAGSAPAAIPVAGPLSCPVPAEAEGVGPMQAEAGDETDRPAEPVQQGQPTPLCLPLAAAVPLPVPPDQGAMAEPPAGGPVPATAGIAARPSIPAPPAKVVPAETPAAPPAEGVMPAAATRGASLASAATLPATDDSAAPVWPGEGATPAARDRSPRQTLFPRPAASASGHAMASNPAPAGPPDRPESAPHAIAGAETPLPAGLPDPAPGPDRPSPVPGRAPPLPEGAASPAGIRAQDTSVPQMAQAHGLAPAPASPAPPAETSAPPPPPRPTPILPVRQLAPVCVALALGPGQAPRLTVALEPEELGPVEIRIERDAEGDTATVQVTAARPETLALLQRDARELDRALQQAGIPLEEGALRFGLSGQDQPGGQGGGGGGGHPRRGPAPPDRSIDPPARPAASVLSLLDIAI